MSEKRIRLWAGGAGAALCSLAFVVGMIRDQHHVMFGAFLGIMVAGNVIPFSEVKNLSPWHRHQ